MQVTFPLILFLKAEFLHKKCLISLDCSATAKKIIFMKHDIANTTMAQRGVIPLLEAKLPCRTIFGKGKKVKQIAQGTSIPDSLL